LLQPASAAAIAARSATQIRLLAILWKPPRRPRSARLPEGRIAAWPGLSARKEARILEDRSARVKPRRETGRVVGFWLKGLPNNGSIDPRIANAG